MSIRLMPTQIDSIFRVPSLLPRPTFSRPNLPTRIRRLVNSFFFCLLELSLTTTYDCTSIAEMPYGCTRYSPMNTDPCILSETSDKPILPWR